jgi:hypothetical protein
MADDTQAKRVRQILVEHQIFLSTAAWFNDPFDCSPQLDDVATEEDYFRFWSKHLPSTREGQALAASRAKALAEGDPEARRSSANALEELRAALLNKIGILCMNVDPLHQLMWAHYGDSHRGICLQFNGQHPCFEGAEPVRYLSARPTMNNYTQSDGERITAALRTKSVVWSYEGEWRLASAQFVGNASLPRESIASVIIGARASEQTIASVNEWCASNAPPIPTYSAQLQGRSYDIEIPGLPL